MPFLQISVFLGLEMQKGIVVNPVPTAFNECFQAFRGHSCAKKIKKIQGIDYCGGTFFM
jgi:hypothetical protein